MMKLSNRANAMSGLPEIFPNTFYSLERDAEFAELACKTGFNCQGCGIQMLVSLDEETACSSCDHPIDKNYVIAADHFFIFNLQQLITLMAEEHGIVQPVINADRYERYSDGAVYKRLLELKPGQRVITLQLSLDGVQLAESTTKQMWPLFVKINELNAPEPKKVILLSCFVGEGKPNADFFLDNVVEQLNYLFDNGILLRLPDEQLVYPLVLDFMLDMPARSWALEHSGHNAKFGCTSCKAEGVTYFIDRDQQRHKTIFRPSNVRDYKSESLYRRLAYNELPYFGLFRISKLSLIQYRDCFEMCVPEPMHLIWINFVPRILRSMFERQFRNSICSLYKKEPVLNERIKLFGTMDKFKRKPRPISQRTHFNASENLIWFLYVSPVVLKGVMRRKGYAYLMLLAHAISNFWCGLPKSELEDNHKLIKVICEDLESVFNAGEYTLSAHQLLHLKRLVEKYGPLSCNNSFIFESANGECRRLIKGSFATNEQVSNEYRRLINLNVRHENVDEKVKLFKKFKDGDRENCFKKITKGGTKFTSRLHHLDKASHSRNDTVKMSSGVFLAIEYFFVENEEIYVFGRILKKIEDLKFCYSQIRLSLSYISYVKLESDFSVFPFDEIVEKVHLVREFEAGTSEQLPNGNLYVIDLIHIYHN